MIDPDSKHDETAADTHNARFEQARVFISTAAALCQRRISTPPPPPRALALFFLYSQAEIGLLQIPLALARYKPPNTQLPRR